MLRELKVKNYALLSDVSVEFGAGFNALTGETGAGKSLLVGALELLLGKKALSSFIRTGCEEAEVSGVLTLDRTGDAMDWLDRHDIVVEDDGLVIRRVVKSSGRSSAYLQGSPVSREALEELSAFLFDMHGQHDHQSLYVRTNQRKLLDRAAGLEDRVITFSERFSLLKKMRERLKEDQEKRADALREKESLRQALEEIDALKPSAEKEEELKRKLSRMENRERVYAALDKFDDLTLIALNRLHEAATTLKSVDKELVGADIERYDGMLIDLIDLRESLSSTRSSFSYSAEELESMASALAAIQRLEKKYGGSMETLLKFAVNAREKLLALESGEERDAELSGRIEVEQAALVEEAKQLSVLRKERAVALEGEVEERLRELDMPHAHFKVSVKERVNAEGHRALGPAGMDAVEFLFAANRGEPLKPLREIASGGEAGRTLLAIKSALAEQDRMETLIFDEIDAGIGGRAALAVASHIRKLAASKQIICISHLASVASHADCQLVISKGINMEGRTITNVRRVIGEERVEEISRMISGKQDETSMAHARSLLADHAVRFNRKESQFL